MKVVVACVPASGHFHPLIPLARALVDAGDEVVVASGPSVCAHAEGLGMQTAVVGPDVPEWMALLASRVRGAPGDGLPPERILHYFYPRLFGECGAPLMADDLVPLVERIGADLVVFESTTLAGPLAAAVAGVPGVHHTVSVLPSIDIWQLCADAVSPLWRSFGLEPRPFAGLFEDLTLAIWPATLDAAAGYGAKIERMRPVVFDTTGDEGLPPWLSELGDAPTVYMTLGTELNTDTSVFRAALDGLADEPVNLVVTVGRDNDPAMLEPIPQNARVERYIPQSLLLPHCDAVISHGGSGTTLAVLSQGLPQLVIPQGADQFLNGDLCAEAGAAHTLLPEQVSPDAVRAAVQTMLVPGAPERRGAGLLASEIEAMPTPAQWVPRLRQLAEAGPSGG